MLGKKTKDRLIGMENKTENMNDEKWGERQSGRRWDAAVMKDK